MNTRTNGSFSIVAAILCLVLSFSIPVYSFGQDPALGATGSSTVDSGTAASSVDASATQPVTQPGTQPVNQPATQPGTQPGVQPAKSGGSTFWTLVNAGGTIGFVLFFLSIAALALVIDLLRSLRRSEFIPPGLSEDTRELIGRGQLLAADQRCKMNPSCLAYVINAGLTESDGDWPDIEKTIEDSMAEQSARYMRRLEYLSVIGNIAPMLGLLGTVVGMVFAFRLLAETQGTPRPSELAEGIYLALVTTVEGLLVAIPSLGAYAWLRGRLDKLMGEVAFQAQYVFIPLKRAIRSGKKS